MGKHQEKSRGQVCRAKGGALQYLWQCWETCGTADGMWQVKEWATWNELQGAGMAGVGQSLWVLLRIEVFSPSSLGNQPLKSFKAEGDGPFTAVQRMDLCRGEAENLFRRSFDCPNKRGPWLRPEGGSRRPVNGGVTHWGGETRGGGGLRGKAKSCNRLLVWNSH